jgi:hypothetical protein
MRLCNLVYDQVSDERNGRKEEFSVIILGLDAAGKTASESQLQHSRPAY